MGTENGFTGLDRITKNYLNFFGGCAYKKLHYYLCRKLLNRQFTLSYIRPNAIQKDITNANIKLKNNNNKQSKKNHRHTQTKSQTLNWTEPNRTRDETLSIRKTATKRTESANTRTIDRIAPNAFPSSLNAHQIDGFICFRCFSNSFVMRVEYFLLLHFSFVPFLSF